MIRFGVIGTNWITDHFLKAAAEVEGFSLTAVYSRTAERAKEYAEKHGAAAIYTSVEELAQSNAVDAVYIASPNSLHAEQAIACMNAGKHVLCEKPLASNAAEAREMIAAAKRNNVLLMEAMKSTLLPNFQAMKEHMHKLGKIRRYVANYNQYSSRYDAYKAGTILNAFKPELSNGSLMDLGIYCIYPLIVLFGKPDKLQASAVALDSGVDGEGSILLTYSDMEAVVMYSKITNSSLPSEIQGEAASMVIHKISQPDRVEIHYRDGRIEDITTPQTGDSMAYEIREFVRLVQSGKTESAVNTYANSLAVMELMDEARRQIGLVYPADERA